MRLLGIVRAYVSSSKRHAFEDCKYAPASCMRIEVSAGVIDCKPCRKRLEQGEQPTEGHVTVEESA